MEIQQVGTDPAEFKNHQLPLARIKKVNCLCTLLLSEDSPYFANCTHSAHLSRLQIMKSDEDVRMISAEAPVLFAKVCKAACHTAGHLALHTAFFSGSSPANLLFVLSTSVLA